MKGNRALLTIEKHGSKIARNSVLIAICRRQIAMKSSVSNHFWSTVISCINSFNCRLSGVIQQLHLNFPLAMEVINMEFTFEYGMGKSTRTWTIFWYPYLGHNYWLTIALCYYRKIECFTKCALRFCKTPNSELIYEVIWSWCITLSFNTVHLIWRLGAYLVNVIPINCNYRSIQCIIWNEVAVICFY